MKINTSIFSKLEPEELRQLLAAIATEMSATQIHLALKRVMSKHRMVVLGEMLIEEGSKA
jgi:hypothetical protein